MGGWSRTGQARAASTGEADGRANLPRADRRGQRSVRATVPRRRGAVDGESRTGGPWYRAHSALRAARPGCAGGTRTGRVGPADVPGGGVVCRLGAAQPDPPVVRREGPAMALAAWVIRANAARRPNRRRARRADDRYAHSVSQKPQSTTATVGGSVDSAPRQAIDFLPTKTERSPERAVPITGRQLLGSEHGKVGGSRWLARRRTCVCRVTGRELDRRLTEVRQAERGFGWKRTGALTCVGICSGRERRASSLTSGDMAPSGRATAARRPGACGARSAHCVKDAHGSQIASGARRR